MPWSDFTATFSATDGPVQLWAWECDDRAARLGPQPRRFCATLAIGDRIESATAHASGPVAALTAMLYERGIGVEMTRFHQLASGPHTATFVQGSDGCRREWAMGWSEDATQSALRAVIESHWFCRRLELLDSDQGLGGPFRSIERGFELGGG